MENILRTYDKLRFEKSNITEDMTFILGSVVFLLKKIKELGNCTNPTLYLSTYFAVPCVRNGRIKGCHDDRELSG